jgi:hypothetical protein
MGESDKVAKMDNVALAFKKSIFTLPVELTDFDDEGKLVKGDLLIRYQFNDLLQEKLGKGIFDQEETDKRKAAAEALAGNGNEVPPVEDFYRAYTANEQLAEIVVGIKDVEGPLDVEFWRSRNNKFKQAILNAIERDINPLRTSSVG